MNSSQINPPRNTPAAAWSLFCAAADGNLEAIEDLVSRQPELVHHQIWYEIPLHFAVRGGHEAAVRLLLEAGSNPAFSNFTYSSWQSLLTIAEQRGYAAVKSLLVSEMERRFQYAPKYEALWKAISDGEQETVERLISEAPDLLTIGDCHGNRALHWAVSSRRLPIIETLLGHGVDLHALRADLQSPLHLSVTGDYWYGKANHCDPNVTAQAVTEFLQERGAKQEFGVAAFQGDLGFVREVLDNDPATARRLNESRWSPLRHAARGGQMEVVRLLLEHGADPSLAEHCASNGAALYEACCRQDVGMVELLLEHGADPSAEIDSCGSCLSNVAESSTELIELLNENGAKDGLWSLRTPEQILERMQDDDNPGILQTIIDQDFPELLAPFIKRFGAEPIRLLDPANGWSVPKSREMLGALLGHGMDINRPDWYGQTHLHLSVLEIERAAWLIEAGADVNAVDFLHGTTALGLAAMNGSSEMVKLLLDKGADPSLPKESEWAQPRVLVERHEKWWTERLVRTHMILKQLEADPQSLLAPDSNALHSAAHYSEEEVVWALLEAGADIEAEHPHRGGKPLHWATEGNVKIMQWLLDRGADVNSRVVSDNERNGMTPLIYCAWWCGDDEECIANADLLIASGADLKARDAEGKSAVERARQQGHDNLAKALEARGCD